VKLQRLTLRDFLNHRDTTIEFGDLTVIVGPNNAGKSAVKDAIEMVLTGTARTTDKAGREAADVIRTGAGHFDLRAEVAAAGDCAAGDGGEARHSLVISRTKSRAGDRVLEISEQSEEKWRTWEGPIPQKQKALYQVLGAEAGLIRACLHAGQLPSMKPDEQEALIFGTLGLDFTDGRICELLQSCGCVEGDAQLLYGGRDNTFLAAPPRESYGPEVFDEAHKYAYEKRRQTKRDLRSAQDELEQAGEQVAHLERDTPKLAKLEDRWLDRNRPKLKDLQDERDRLIEEKGRSDSLPKEIAAVEETIETLKAEAKQVKQWERAAEKLAGEGTEFDDVFQKHKGLAEDRRRSLQSLQLQLETTESAIESFSSGTPKCPLTDAPCPMSKDDQKQLLKSLRAERTKLKKSVKGLEEEVAETGEIMAKFEAVVDSRPRRGLEGIEAELADSREYLKKLKSEAKKASGDDIENLTERIDLGRERIRVVEQYLKAKMEYERRRTTHGELEAHVESWERLVKALGPGEAKLKAVEQPLQDLQVRINERLLQYTRGYAIRMETAGGFELKVSTPGTGDEWIPMKGLSTSERLRVGIVLQDALAHLSGLRFLLIDNLDMLDAANRGLLGAALQAWKSDYETIVLLMTGNKRPEKCGGVTYWLENAQAELVFGSETA